MAGAMRLRLSFPARRGKLACALALVAIAVPMPAAARDSLGMFEQWGAFRDAGVPRCYAIARSDPGKGGARGYADVGTWPRRNLRGRVHVRLSKRTTPGSIVQLTVGAVRVRLDTNGADAWPQDPRAEAAILAAMRSSASLRVSARDLAGHGFSDSYPLAGAATAIDAAAVGCARG
jgi:hypothetical protein